MTLTALTAETPQTVQRLTADTFNQEISGPLPALVDFGAGWCAPCRAIAPVLEQLAHEEAGRLRVFKVDVDESPEIANRFHVIGLPALVLFKDGHPAGRLVGFHSKARLAAALAPHLAGGMASTVKGEDV